ncbi:WD repeat-containing protein 35 [Eumeta japonica]|uniref:WD repeat-containing protein 35 n=1 Tax=Eumeta variegata TaxID=151549 RepID=A0A4C1Y6R9_EUMVA|nr:WD repeat-containing protein 35 [Eumeta japonica]
MSRSSEMLSSGGCATLASISGDARVGTPYARRLCLRAAARLESVLSELHQAQLVQAWCTIALIAAESRTFNLCSRAFIKLEALEMDNTFENLAIEIFTKHQPRDPKGNRVHCPSCHISLSDWCSYCRACGAEWAGCAASARPLRDPNTLWRCAVCAHAALQHELVLRHSCPMCHTHIITS